MKKCIALAAVLTALLSIGTVSVFAADTNTSAPTDAYGYLTGQSRSQSRNELYNKASELESEEEQEAFLIENGINDTEWSEEAKADYSYASRMQKGASYRVDNIDEENEANNSYSYLIGQQRGPSYSK